MHPEFSVSAAKINTIYPLRIPARHFLLATRYQLPVALLDPLRVPILQQVQGPGCLHSRVPWVPIVKSELENSATPTVPAIPPRAIWALVVKDTFDPTASDKIRPVSAKDKGAALIVGIADPEVPIPVMCNPFGDRIYRAIQLWRRSVEVAIHIQCQELRMLSCAPTVFGRREHVGTVRRT